MKQKESALAQPHGTLVGSRNFALFVMDASYDSSHPGAGLQSVAGAGKAVPPSAGHGVACRNAMPPRAPTANT